MGHSTYISARRREATEVSANKEGGCFFLQRSDRVEHSLLELPKTHIFGDINTNFMKLNPSNRGIMIMQASLFIQIESYMPYRGFTSICLHT